jgi:16S rRNA G966 N2-methylase RsmD
MTDGIRHTLFGNFDPSTIAANADFKEDSVRAVIIDPILRELGWTHEEILRAKVIKTTGQAGTKKKEETLIPDYLLRLFGKYACVLEAKSPSQRILDTNHIRQAHSYAAHFEIHSVYFALCNGVEFALFRTSDPEKPILYFYIEEIDAHWGDLLRFLSPESFTSPAAPVYVPPFVQKEFDYKSRPLPQKIIVRKEGAKRHFGVHGYFTRQSWDIVSRYIKNFSAQGDVVLDSFGGSGVTAVEALVNGRKAINVDLNPLAVFIVKSLLTPVNIREFNDSYQRVCEEYIKKEPKTKEQIEKTLEKYPGPKNLTLPKGSDVRTVPQLFSAKQTARLALLKAIIKKEKKKHQNIYDVLMLMFSGLITKINLTYHQSSNRTAGRGDASAFRYYRYRLAKEEIDLDIMKYFQSRYKRIIAAKQDLEIQGFACNPRISVEQMFANAQIIKGSATNLSFLDGESVDYIYTDPPYGKKIQYLDLSAMWIAWLDMDVSEEDYALEAIEGGSREKSKDEYKKLIQKSIEEMYRVLKFDRWLSFVFAHKDPEFWHLIIETCERCGLEYKGVVSQNNGQTSFKKRQHSHTVLSGQLIINFFKVKTPRALLKQNLGMDIGDLVMQTIEGIIAKNDGAAIEEINNELIKRGLEMGFLHLMKKEYSDINPLLEAHFDYSFETGKYTIRPHSKFASNIDLKLRVRYYVVSYLTSMELQGKTPTFNEIVYNIMPLLKNGVTPEQQTILTVLQDIAERIDVEDDITKDGWRLKRGDRGLFE